MIRRSTASLILERLARFPAVALVKLTSQPDAHDVARLDRAAELVGATRRVLVSQTRRPAFSESHISSGLRPLLRHLLAEL